MRLDMKQPHGRPVSITQEMFDELQRRYRVWKANRPKTIARDLGIPIGMFWHYTHSGPVQFGGPGKKPKKGTK